MRKLIGLITLAVALTFSLGTVSVFASDPAPAPTDDKGKDKKGGGHADEEKKDEKKGGN